MDEYIRKTDAIIAIRNLYPDMPRINFNGSKVKWRETYDSFIKCETEIMRIPPETNVRIRRGKWTEEPLGFYCSECGHPIDFHEKTPYCPMCGAKMDL